MATLAPRAAPRSADDRFFFTLSVWMALVLVAGFSFNLAMGRSTFAAPLTWHLHAVVFMAWIAVFLAQSWFATHGSIALHRRLGWLAALWVPLLVVFGIAITVATIRRGTTPFFFQPQHFLIANPLGVLCFAALTFAAIRFRRQLEWHRPLQICAFAALLGPGFGRLLPSPLLTPYAFEASVLAGLIFPAIAMLRERRQTGRIAPAWWWGVGSICAVLLVAVPLARSPIGDGIYASVVAGSPAESIPGLAYGKPPPGL